MAGSDVCVRRPPGGGLASVATDHVRLSYHYLNVGDIDGYGSLFSEQAVLRGPQRELLCGRAELERFERCRQRTGRATHRVLDVVATGRVVVAIGCVEDGADRADGPQSSDFVDVFVICDDGLIAERRTIHLVSTE